MPGRGCSPNIGHERAGHRLRIAEPGQLGEPRAVTEVREHLGRDLQREAGLADAADTREGHDRPGADALGDSRRSRSRAR